MTPDIIISSSTGFSPSPKTIFEGLSCTWRNDDTVPHTVTTDHRKVIDLDSGDIPPGGTFTLQTGPGMAKTFTYHCRLHPHMRGEITIQAGE